jgi:4-carboxymuconolactone decarboxylase
MDQSDFEKGWNLLSELAPGQPEALTQWLDAIAPGMARLVISFGYGEVLSRPGLDLKSRQTVTVAALAAKGSVREQLAFHIAAALTAGVTPEEVVEIIYLVVVFAGFPAGLNALAVAREVFGARGVKPGQVKPYEEGTTRRERGLAALEATSKGAGRAVVESLADIAPALGEFILDFSYGDVIARQVLSPRHKELAMIAVAAACGTMRPQLKVHVLAGLAVGLGQAEIVEALIQIAVYAGFPAALNALSAAREAFENR